MTTKGKDDVRTVQMSEQGYKSIINTEDGRNLFWTSDINAELPIKLQETGCASRPPVTSPQLLTATVKQFEKQPMW